MGNIIRRRRRLSCIHETRGKDGWTKTSVQAMDGSPEGKRIKEADCERTGRTREDIRCLDMPWSEAIDLAENREGWKDCVARCAAMQWMDYK